MPGRNDRVTACGNKVTAADANAAAKLRCDTGILNTTTTSAIAASALSTSAALMLMSYLCRCQAGLSSPV